MATLQRVCGHGTVKIDGDWTNAYFRYEYLGQDDTAGIPPEDEAWVLRIPADAAAESDLRPGRCVRLRLPGQVARHAVVRRSWAQAPFVWVELDTGYEYAVSGPSD
jgi:hypothetical protein